MAGVDFPSVPKLRIALLVAGAFLGGCGQRGPLLLPGPDAEPVAAEALPANENEDSAEEEDETSGE